MKVGRCFGRLLTLALSAIASSAWITLPASAAELSEIRDRGYLIVAIKNNQAPLGFVDEAGDLSGFEVDIARRLAAELLGNSSAVKLVPVANVDRLNAVLQERVDIAIARITITEPRRRLVDFSYPYYLDGTAFITNRPAVQQLRDLNSSTIALLDRASSVPHVRYILPGAQLVGVSSYAEGQRLLASGTVDAFAGDASILTGWIRPAAPGLENFLSGGDYRLLPRIISVEPLSVAIPKGQQHASLKAAINQAIRDWYEAGWLQSQSARWGLPLGVLPSLAPDLEQDL